MRVDSLGLFWEDTPPPKGNTKRGPRERGPMPQIPVTGWKPPTEFPNLSAAKVIGVDTETFDPELLDAGPGWGRGKGHIIGASLSVADGTSWYFPTKHGIEDGKQVLTPEEASMNMDHDQVMRFLKHVLEKPVPKVGANMLYDFGWLMTEGIEMQGRIYDIQYAEALLDSETPSVSLDALANKYLNVGKETNHLYQWLADWCGGAVNDRQRKNLYLSPPSLAGPYGEGDASLPIQVLNHQWGRMIERGVLDLFDLECRLIPLLVKMRMKGAPVDPQFAEATHSNLGGKLELIEEKLTHLAGQPVNPNAMQSCRSAFENLGIPLPQIKDKKTGEMKVSFSAGLLETIEHPLAEAILEHRQTAKVRNTFVKSYIMDKHVNGRIHCSFHPLKGEGRGARSGRFSSSDPNLQNIPVRSEIGQLVRQMFAAKEGARWRGFDYSSIEYRMLAHHAVGEGAEEIRAIYQNNPMADYHAIVGDLIYKLTGIRLERGKVKTINFGIIYGMALNALAAALNLPKKEAKILLDDYHLAAPYARATMDMCAAEVHRTGHVTTILGRKSDFSGWAPKKYDPATRGTVLTYEAACSKWGMYNIERSHTHKALNRKLQGGAADVMKKGMVMAYESGLFDEQYCGIPILTVHDELDFEDYGDLHAPCWAELKHVMENCMGDLLRVPLIVDADIGQNWAEAH